MLNKIKNYLMGYVNYIVYEPSSRLIDIISAISGNYKHNNQKRTFSESYIHTFFVFTYIFVIIITLLEILNLMSTEGLALPILSVLFFSSAVTFILRALTK